MSELVQTRGEDVTRQSIRTRWPKGLVGTLGYFTDHVLFRFEHPIDWMAVGMYEDYGIGRPISIRGQLVFLSFEECDICRMVCEGATDDDIAARLNIKIGRIGRLVADLMARLGFTCRVEFAQQMGQYAL